MGVNTLPFSFLSPTENFKPISACHLLLSCSLIFTNAEKDKYERYEEDEMNAVSYTNLRAHETCLDLV